MDTDCLAYASIFSFFIRGDVTSKLDLFRPDVIYGDRVPLEAFFDIFE